MVTLSGFGIKVIHTGVIHVTVLEEFVKGW